MVGQFWSTGLVFILLASCSAQKWQIQPLRWNQSLPIQPPPSILNDTSFSEPMAPAHTDLFKTQFNHQKIGQAFIRNGHLYIVHQTGQLNSLRYQSGFDTQATDRLPIIKKAQDLHQNRDLFFERLQKKSALFRQGQLAEPIKVYYDPNSSPEFYYGVTFFTSTGDQVLECLVGENLTLKNCERVSHHFEVPAWLYTLKNWNDLQEVLLSNIKPSSKGLLTSETHQVSTQAPSGVSHQDFPFKFEPQDYRFDQVQAYYWVDRAIQMTKNIWGLSVPERIEVATFLGYPDLTNAVLAYNNQIRVGRGDGVNYKELANDPSVIIHEVGHVYINHLAHLGSQGQSGSLNEAFADYFAATLTQSPDMGARSFLKGPHRRTLNQRLSFKNIQNKLYADSLIISSALWEIELIVGPEKAQALFIESLVELGPAISLQEYPPILSKILEKHLAPHEKNTVYSALQAREWPGF